jgi:hypothetical protein
MKGGVAGGGKERGGRREEGRKTKERTNGGTKIPDFLGLCLEEKV